MFFCNCCFYKRETAFPADCDYILEALKSEIQKVKNDDEEKYENLFFWN